MKLRSLLDPLMLLMHDALAAEQQLDATSGQFERRSYVRSSMAVIEGTIWLLKQTCLKAKDVDRSRQLSIAEFAIMSDETYDLKSNGAVRTTTKFLKLPDNLRFTINTCNRLFGSNLDLQVGQQPWDRFLKAVEIRNRIMHPKDVADFEISDSEIEDCKEMVNWFNALLYSFIEQLLSNSAKTKREPEKA